MKEFEILSVCKLSSNKSLVLSRNRDGKFVMAKRYNVEENGGEKFFYEKGAIVIEPENFVVFLKNLLKSVDTDL